MVQAAKVFVLESPLHPSDLARKLRDFSSLREQEVDGRSVEIGSKIIDLHLREDKLSGTFEENLLLSLRYMDEPMRVPITLRTLFEFLSFEGATYLIVAARKSRANRIANQLSSAISAEKGFIQEAWISSEALREFYESRMETVRVIFFNEVKIPNVSKLSLYGKELAGTNLYQEYVRLGNVWYVVFEPEEGVLIGLTKNCTVTFFSKLSVEEAMGFIEARILPMIRGKFFNV